MSLNKETTANLEHKCWAVVSNFGCAHFSFEGEEIDIVAIILQRCQ